MPVVPSYTGFAATPNLAESFLGGARVALGREQLAQQAQEASMRMAMENERLNQQRAIAEMELSAKQAAEAQERLRRQQELEIEKSYKQAQIGLEERRLQQYQRKLAQDIQESARAFAAQQQYQQEMSAPGADALKVLMRLGPSVGASIPSAAFPKPTDSGLAAPVEYTSPETGRAYYRGEPEGDWRIQSQEYDVEGRMMRDEERSSIQKQIDTLTKAQLSAEAFGITEDFEPKTDRSMSMKDAYIKRKAQIKELEDQLKSMRSSPRSQSGTNALKILSVRRK